MSDGYKQILVQNVESVVPNSRPVTLNNVSNEHKGWFTFAEIETKYFISKVLNDDSICIDIGANIGMYSLLFLQLSSSSKVIAFEPSSNFGFLNQNIPDEFKDRFHAVQIALGDKNGSVEEEIWESFGHNKVKDIFEFATLDAFLERNPVDKIDIIKIDTDGFETQILTGAINSLMKYSPLLIIESDPDPKSGQNSEKISITLKSLGYIFFGTLDGNNDVYVHASCEKKQEIKRMISRRFMIRKSFLGTLTPVSFEIDQNTHYQELHFSSSSKSKTFFQKFFRTNGKPWNYAATSSVIDSNARYIRFSGLILGADANLICTSDNIPTLFSLPLPAGLYSRILIPLKNTEGASNIRIILRSGGRKGKSIVLGSKVVSVS